MILGRSAAIRKALDVADLYSRTRLPILIIGETGTGKEEFARHVHQLSGRSGAFVDVNCAALPREMTESLFFGHKRGAFTGAVESTVGYCALSDRGTLLLDELASLPLELQGKLLRVLESGEVPTLGASTKRVADIRWVAAAQSDLSASMAASTFRIDLYQRLAGAVIELPPLQQRMEDVVPLAEHFATLEGRTLEPDVRSVLLEYGWPGNVRELRFAIERAGYLVTNGTLSADAVTEAIALGGPQSTRTPAPTNLRRTGLLAVCQRNNFDAKRIALELGCRKSALYVRLKSAGISLRAFRFS